MLPASRLSGSTLTRVRRFLPHLLCSNFYPSPAEENLFQLSSMSVVPDFFRTFVYGEQKSILPLSVIRVSLPDENDSNKKTTVLLVMCSDGQLRVFSLDKPSPLAVFPVVDHAVDKALMRALLFEKTEFRLVIYVAEEDRSYFKEFLFDIAAFTLKIRTHIPDPQLPLVDICMSPTQLWALWRTADGYMLQHWPSSKFVVVSSCTGRLDVA